MDDTSKIIVRCTACGAANRIPAGRAGDVAKCGKCHEPLPKPDKKSSPPDTVKIRCTDCGAKNRIPGSKLDAGPRCGKCGAKLRTEELSTPQPVMISDGNFENLVLKSPLPVLMWAWAPW